METLFSILYSLLKIFGLWEGILAQHKARELEHDKSKIISLSDTAAIDELHKKYDR